MEKNIRRSILATVLITGALGMGANFISKSNVEVGASTVSSYNDIVVENYNVQEEKQYNYLDDVRGNDDDAFDEAIISIYNSASKIERSVTPDTHSVFDLDKDWPFIWDQSTEWQDWDSDGTIDIYDYIYHLDEFAALLDTAWEDSADWADFINGHDNTATDPSQPTMDDIVSITDVNKIPDTPFGLAVQDMYTRYEAYYSANVNGEDWNVDTPTTSILPMSTTWTDWALIPKYAWPFIVAKDATDRDEATIKSESMAEVYNKAVAHYMEEFELPDPILASDIILDSIAHIDASDILAAFVDGNTYGPVALPRINWTFPTITWTDIPTVKSIYEFENFDGLSLVDGTIEKWLVDLNVVNGGSGYPTVVFPTDYVKTSVVSSIEAALHAAIDEAVPSMPAINDAIFNNIWNGDGTTANPGISGDVEIFAAALDVFANAIITEVASIDASITAFNAKIIALNDAVNNYNNVTVPAWNTKIVELNAEIKAVETEINGILSAFESGSVVDWTEIETLVNALNTLIDTINVEIADLNAFITTTVAEVNVYIEENFGLLNVYVDYYNLTVTLVYESIYYSIWYYAAIELVEAEGGYIPNPIAVDGMNKYQDTAGVDSTGTYYDGSTVKYPFKEVSITDADGNVIPVNATNPRLTEVPTETYDITFEVSVRQDKDYRAFDPTGVDVYDGDGNKLTSTITQIGVLESDVPTSTIDGNFDGKATNKYDIYNYQVVVEDLVAGKPYDFYMEINSDANIDIDGKDTDLYDGFEYSIKVNQQQVIFYMPTEVTHKTLGTNITEVAASASFKVTDNNTYWNIDGDDVDADGNPDHFDFKIYEGTSATGTDITSSLATDTTITYTDDTYDPVTGTGNAFGTYSVDIAKGLLPDTDYFIEIYTQSYNKDDGLIGIDTTEAYQLDWSGTFRTLPWKAPQAPTITIEAGTAYDSETYNKKHKKRINYELVIPGGDELIGQDITYVNSISVYKKKSSEATYEATPSVVFNPTNNGATGVTTDVTDTGEIILGDPTTEATNTELELGTEYYAKFVVEYQGLNAGASTVTTVESNELIFFTEGKSPAELPTFDILGGFKFVEGEQGTDSAKLTFKFTDPATDPDKTNTVIEKVSFTYEDVTNASGTYVELQQDDANVAITWDSGSAPDTNVDNINAADIHHTGSVIISGLNPNADYNFAMNLYTNSIPTIDSDPVTEKITVTSNTTSGKTLKLDAQVPTWDATADFEFVNKTQNTLTYSYKFNVPENDATHKNTYFDSMAVYVGNATGTLTEITDEVPTDLTPTDPTDDVIYYSLVEDNALVVTDAIGSNGTFAGTITFHNLLPNTTYFMQLGIKSHSYDDDYPTPTIEIPEVLSTEESEITIKLPSVNPWFDEDGSSLTNGGLGNETSFIVNDVVDGNTIDATFDYKFYLPNHDDYIFDTTLDNVKLMYKSSFSGEGTYAEFTDITHTPGKVGEVVTLTTPHETNVTADDGKVYDLSLTSVVEYSGSIAVHNLHPEEAYTFQLIVSTLSEDTLYTIDPIYSNELSFNSSMLPPAKPYFGSESDESDGLYATSATDTTLSFDFDFVIPATAHGYEAGILKALNVYAGTDSSSLSLLTETTDYDIAWRNSGTAVTGGYGPGQYVGTVTLKNLNVNTRYYIQLEIDSNYYAGADNTATETVLSPKAASTTLTDVATAPEITSAEVFYDKDIDKFGISIDINTFNGLTSDPTGSKADALIDTIHVGTSTDADLYMDTPYSTTSTDNGAGQEMVHYELIINDLPFSTTISDMVVTADWSDDGTSMTPASGSITYEVPSFTTPDIDVITPVFDEETTYVSETTSNSAKLAYDISSSTTEFAPETYIDRITIQGFNPILLDEQGNVIENSKNGARGLETYYDSKLDSNFTPGLSGEILIEGLEENAIYSGLTISVEYSMRDTNDKEVLSEGSSSMKLTSFQTQPIGTLTPGVNPQPSLPIVEDSKNNEIIWIIVLFGLLIGTGVTIITYSRIKNK